MDPFTDCLDPGRRLVRYTAHRSVLVGRDITRDHRPAEHAVFQDTQITLRVIETVVLQWRDGKIKVQCCQLFRVLSKRDRVVYFLDVRLQEVRAHTEENPVNLIRGFPHHFLQQLQIPQMLLRTGPTDTGLFSRASLRGQRPPDSLVKVVGHHPDIVGHGAQLLGQRLRGNNHPVSNTQTSAQALFGILVARFGKRILGRQGKHQVILAKYHKRLVYLLAGFHRIHVQVVHGVVHEQGIRLQTFQFRVAWQPGKPLGKRQYQGVCNLFPVCNVQGLLNTELP